MTELSPALAGHTGYLLHRVHVHAAGIAEREFPAGHHPRHVAILGGLAAAGPRSQSELAQRFAINRTVMVKLIDDLERDGLVERRRNSDDRRSYALHLTPAGGEMLERLEPHMKRSDAELTAGLDAGERQALNALLRALLQRDGTVELPPGLSDRTGYLVAKAHLRHRAIGDRAFAPLGIDVRDFGVLTALSAGRLSQQDLARQFSVSGTIVVQIIDELERRGLVERRRSPDDRRSYALELTESGGALRARAHVVLDGIFDELAGAIGEDGDRELARLLRKLLQGTRPTRPAADGEAVAQRPVEAGRAGLVPDERHGL